MDVVPEGGTAPESPRYAFCPRCGQARLDGTAFCAGCGFAFGPVAAPRRQPTWVAGQMGTWSKRRTLTVVAVAALALVAVVWLFVVSKARECDVQSGHIHMLW